MPNREYRRQLWKTLALGAVLLAALQFLLTWFGVFADIETRLWFSDMMEDWVESAAELADLE